LFPERISAATGGGAPLTLGLSDAHLHLFQSTFDLSLPEQVDDLYVAGGARPHGGGGSKRGAHVGYPAGVANLEHRNADMEERGGAGDEPHRHIGDAEGMTAGEWL
jgi:hypothetical protein